MKINFSSHWEDCGKIEENNEPFGLNILFVSYNSEEIQLLYKSKYNSERKYKVVLLVIYSGTFTCYHFAVKSILELYSSEWLKNKKAAINNDNNTFQNALNDVLNYYNTKTDPKRKSNIEPFIKKYNWQGIEFPSHKEDWKKFEENNNSISLDILYVPHNTKQTRLAYKSKYNYKRNNQVILLMITDWWKMALSCYKKFTSTA